MLKDDDVSICSSEVIIDTKVAGASDGSGRSTRHACQSPRKPPVSENQRRKLETLKGGCAVVKRLAEFVRVAECPELAALVHCFISIVVLQVDEVLY